MPVEIASAQFTVTATELETKKDVISQRKVACMRELTAKVDARTESDHTLTVFYLPWTRQHDDILNEDTFARVVAVGNLVEIADYLNQMILSAKVASSRKLIVPAGVTRN